MCLWGGETYSEIVGTNTFVRYAFAGTLRAAVIERTRDFRDVTRPFGSDRTAVVVIEADGEMARDTPRGPEIAGKPGAREGRRTAGPSPRPRNTRNEIAGSKRRDVPSGVTPGWVRAERGNVGGGVVAIGWRECRKRPGNRL